MDKERLTQMGRFIYDHPQQSLLLMRALGESRLNPHFTGTPIRTTLDDGTLITVVLPERVSSVIFRGKVYEPDISFYLKQQLQPGDTYIDIGAHIGIHTLRARNIVGNAGHIYAFEPSPVIYNILKLNCDSCPSITIENIAVSDGSRNEMEMRDMGIEFAAWNSLETSRLGGQTKEKARKTFSVRTVSLDKYVQDHQIVPNLIKIDAENSDMSILNGAKKVIEEFHPAIIFEGGDEGRSIENNTQHILDLLSSYGYRFFLYEKTNNAIFQTPTMSNKWNYCNILCTYENSNR